MIPTFDIEKVNNHKQLDLHHSCIPSAVEIVLKLTGKVDSNFYELQHEWKNKANGTFGQFNDRILYGLHFMQKFASLRSNDFPFDDLFKCISSELHSGRYVIVSLVGEINFHAAVIYSEQGEEFLAVTKSFDITTNSLCTTEINDTKNRIFTMGGTDILIYKTEGSI